MWQQLTTRKNTNWSIKNAFRIGFYQERSTKENVNAKDIYRPVALWKGLLNTYINTRTIWTNEHENNSQIHRRSILSEESGTLRKQREKEPIQIHVVNFKSFIA